MLALLMSLSLFVAPSPVLTVPIVPKVELHPALVPICTCESGLQHYDTKTGQVLKGKENPLDTGICQINLKYHGEQAEKLGLNLFEEEGNINYANWLYSKEGTEPWKYSRSCWSPSSS